MDMVAWVLRHLRMSMISFIAAKYLRDGGREKQKGEAPVEEEDEGTHRANSAAGMALADEIWAQRSTAVPAQAKETSFATPKEVEKTVKAAQKSRD